MKKPTYTYSAKIIDVYDGDTFTALVDLGFRASIVITIRLFGVDAPEIKGEERERGLMVKKYVEDLILNKDVIIKTYKDPKDSFKRWLAEIQYDFGNEYPNDLSSLLLIKEYAVPFKG